VTKSTTSAAAIPGLQANQDTGKLPDRESQNGHHCHSHARPDEPRPDGLKAQVRQPGEDHHHACATERGSRQPNKVLCRELSSDGNRLVAV
jgi:hypothetical protein